MSSIKDETIKENYNLNVILIQIESFFDAMILNEIKFTKYTGSIFGKLVENYRSAFLSLPIFGGSTVRI